MRDGARKRLRLIGAASSLRARMFVESPAGSEAASPARARTCPFMTRSQTPASRVGADAGSRSGWRRSRRSPRPAIRESTHAALGEAYELDRGAAPRRRACRTSRRSSCPGTAPAVTGEIPAPAGRADRPALQPLRRRPGRRRVAVDLAAVRADRARRRALRPRDVGLQGERDQPRRRAARLGRQAAGRHQGRSSKARRRSAAATLLAYPRHASGGRSRATRW